MSGELKSNRSMGILIALYVAVILLFFAGIIIMVASSAEVGGVVLILGCLALIGYVVYVDIYNSKWVKDINIICEGDGLHTPGLLKKSLLGLVTCGIYAYFWDYSVQTRLKSNGHRYDVEIPESGSSVILWKTLGMFLFCAGPLIGQHILYQSTNKLAYAYNQGRGNGAGYGSNGQGGGGYIPQNGPAGYISPAQDNPFSGQNGVDPFAGQNGVDPFAGQNGVDPFAGQNGADPFAGQNGGNNPFDATDDYNSPFGNNASNPTPPSQPKPAPAPALAPQPASSTAAGVVQCIKGVSAGQGFKLPAGSMVVVGKSTTKANMVINESHVSNVHCSIKYNPADNTYVVTDHSTNGTFINGQRLKKESPVSVKAGTIISIVNDNTQIKLG